MKFDTRVFYTNHRLSLEVRRIFQIRAIKRKFSNLGLCTYINLNPFQIFYLHEKEREPNAKTRDSGRTYRSTAPEESNLNYYRSSKTYLSSLYHEAYLQNEI